jgi:hypothetical protein
MGGGMQLGSKERATLDLGVERRSGGAFSLLIDGVLVAVMPS